ncbi:hypothetical protein D3C79_1096840 [compost metagenome]
MAFHKLGFPADGDEGFIRIGDIDMLVSKQLMEFTGIFFGQEPKVAVELDVLRFHGS